MQVRVLPVDKERVGTPDLRNELIVHRKFQESGTANRHKAQILATLFHKLVKRQMTLVLTYLRWSAPPITIGQIR